jgi:polysaccharide export outer membrane protein
VTVTVEETTPASVSVLGEVTRPGTYPLDPSAGVLQALAAAGGLTEYAGKSSIFVVRRAPPARVRFAFASLVQADSRAASFRLRAGDVVIVE